MTGEAKGALRSGPGEAQAFVFRGRIGSRRSGNAVRKQGQNAQETGLNFFVFLMRIA